MKEEITLLLIFLQNTTYSKYIRVHLMTIFLDDFFEFELQVTDCLFFWNFVDKLVLGRMLATVIQGAWISPHELEFLLIFSEGAQIITKLPNVEAICSILESYCYLEHLLSDEFEELCWAARLQVQLLKHLNQCLFSLFNVAWVSQLSLVHLMQGLGSILLGAEYLTELQL